MKIKILVVPTLIVVSGFVALNYLKPDFDTYMQKRAVRDTAGEHARQAEAIANNVRALRAEMDVQQSNIDFVKRYLPADKDHGRMFDSLNFLTSQAGLLTSKIDVEEVEQQEDVQATFGVVEPIMNADPLAGAVDPATVPLTPPYQAPKVKRYGVSLEAIGGYTNIKDLATKLNQMDRLQELQSFKISVGESAEAVEGEEATAGGNGSTLTLTYKTRLPYQALPASVAGDAIVSIPGLDQPAFDFTVVDTIKTTATIVPTVVLGAEGKANPFE